MALTLKSRLTVCHKYSKLRVLIIVYCQMHLQRQYMQQIDDSFFIFFYLRKWFTYPQTVICPCCNHLVSAPTESRIHNHLVVLVCISRTFIALVMKRVYLYINQEKRRRIRTNLDELWENEPLLL